MTELREQIINALKEWQISPSAYIAELDQHLPCTSALEVLEYCGVDSNSLAEHIAETISAP